MGFSSIGDFRRLVGVELGAHLRCEVADFEPDYPIGSGGGSVIVQFIEKFREDVHRRGEGEGGLHNSLQKWRGISPSPLGIRAL